MGTRSYCLNINDTQVYVGVHKNSMKIMFTDAAGNEYNEITHPPKANYFNKNNYPNTNLRNYVKQIVECHNSNIAPQVHKENRVHVLPRIANESTENHEHDSTFTIDEDGIRIDVNIFGKIARFMVTDVDGRHYRGVFENVNPKHVKDKPRFKKRVMEYVNNTAIKKYLANQPKHGLPRATHASDSVLNLDSVSSNYASIPVHFNQSFKEVGKKKKKPQEVHSDRYYSREPDMVGIGDSITFMKDGLVRTKVLDEDENYPSYLKKFLGHKVNEVVDGMKIISIEK